MNALNSISHNLVVPLASSDGATLTSKGQVTIPISVREALGIQQGDRILFVADSNGNYSIRPQRSSHHQVAGILHDQVKKSFSEEAFRASMIEHLHSKFAS